MDIIARLLESWTTHWVKLCYYDVALRGVLHLLKLSFACKLRFARELSFLPTVHFNPGFPSLAQPSVVLFQFSILVNDHKLYE